MASAKRKQDEKNLKTLRELVSLPGNKECFDCRQRGPTYVNMTIGSFVCTSCSGMLRGLTPPHRVKSISMATFTQEEIEFVKERGNEYCRRIWLGLMNPSGPAAVDGKDEQKMKDLMSAKYELKRYYLEPAAAAAAACPATPKQQQNGHQAPPLQRGPQYTASATLGRPQLPRSRESRTLANNNNNNNFHTDFVADFSKVPDPFGASPAQSRIGQPIVPQPFFANFDNNPVFSNAAKSPATLANNSAMNGSSATQQPPSEDRYAALKDLDSLMKQAQLKEDNGPASLAAAAATWNTNNSNATNPIWGGNGQTGHVISNPFVSGDLWRPSGNLANNNNNNNNNNNGPVGGGGPSLDGPVCHSANPFKPVQFPVNNVSDNPWAQFGAPTNGDVIQFSQLMAPLSNKMWQPAVPAYHANPFMVGSGVSSMTRNSNNPFL